MFIHTYKGFEIRRVGNHIKYSNDFIVNPVGKEDEEELHEDTTLEMVENHIDTLVN